MTAIRLSEAPLARPQTPSLVQAGHHSLPDRHTKTASHSANDAAFPQLHPRHERAFEVVYVTPQGTLAQLQVRAQASRDDECVIGALRSLRANLRLQGCSELELRELRRTGVEL